MADMGMFQKLMAKKGQDHDMDENYKQSKMKVLKDLHDEMTKMLAGDMHGLKKVTVAAPDKEGLKEGLSHAQELMGHGEGTDEESDHEHEADDEAHLADGGMTTDEEDSAFEKDAMEHNPDEEEESPEDIEAQIRDLQEKLAKKKK